MAVIAVSVDSVVVGTATITTSETFVATVELAGLASDISLALGLLTVPKYLVVVGPIGTSLKLGAGGTDAIQCNPAAVLMEEDLGRALTSILLSNSQAQAASVTVYAGE